MRTQSYSWNTLAGSAVCFSSSVLLVLLCQPHCGFQLLWSCRMVEGALNSNKVSFDSPLPWKAHYFQDFLATLPLCCFDQLLLLHQVLHQFFLEWLKVVLIGLHLCFQSMRWLNHFHWYCCSHQSYFEMASRNLSLGGMNPEVVRPFLTRLIHF